MNPAQAVLWVVGLSIGTMLTLFVGIVILPAIAVIVVAYYVFKYATRPKTVPLEIFYQSALAQVRHIPTRDEFSQSIGSTFLDNHKPHPVWSIFLILMQTADALYKAEEWTIKSPDVHDDVEAELYRKHVTKQIDQAANIDYFKATIHKSFNAVMKHLPPTALTPVIQEEYEGFTIPLKPFVTDEMAHAMTYPFFEANAQKLDLFEPLRYVLEYNAEQTKAQRIGVEHLVNTPFQGLLEAQIPFNFESKRDLGWYICSPAGKGKTNLLIHQLLQDAKTQGSIIVLDSKGDLINAIHDLKLEKEVVVINPDPHLALNPLQIGATSTHSVAFLEYLFSSLMETKPTPLQSTLFRSIFLVLLKVPNASFATFRHFLVHGWKDYDAAIKQLDIEDQEFFYKGEYDSATYKDTKQQLLWRIRDLTTSIPLLREMFKSPVTKINMTEWMDSQKIYLINNSKQLLDDAGAEFFGRFFIAMIRAAADQRSNRRPEDKNPVRLYMDECHTVIARDEKLAGILDECRSQRIQVIAAHQRLPQIQNANVLDALSNCGIRFANSDEDAPALAPRLRSTAEHLRGLPTGSFAAYVRDLTPKGAVTLQIPLVDLSKHPRISRSDEGVRKLAFQLEYCYEPAKAAVQEPAEPPVSDSRF